MIEGEAPAAVSLPQCSDLVWWGRITRHNRTSSLVTSSIKLYLYCLLCLWTMDGHYLARYCRYYPLDVSSSSISSWQQFAHIVTARVPRVLRTNAQCGGGEVSQSGLTKYLRHVWSLLQSPALCNSQIIRGQQRQTRHGAALSNIRHCNPPRPIGGTSGLPTDQNNSALIPSDAQNCTWVHIL